VALGGSRKSASRARALWLALYLLLVLAPLVFALASPRPSGRSFSVDVAAALGFGAFTILALQFVLPARARPFTAPFGVDVLVRFHKQVGSAMVVLVLAHLVMLIIDDPAKVHLFVPVAAPWRAQAGLASVLALGGLLVTTAWRSRLRLSYEDWRAIHCILGVAALGFAFAHLVGVGRYMSLSTVWVTATLALVGATGALFHLRVGRPLRSARSSFRVREVRRERGGATTVALEASGHDGTAFAPGSFAWLKPAEAPFALAEHPFSYASSAHRPASPEFTIKAAGDFTSELHQLRPGAKMLVDGPHGSFEPRPGVSLLLVVAGIGITPAMSILRTIADAGDATPVTLVYGSRRWDEITFREELTALNGRLGIRVFNVLSDPHPAWGGPQGRIGAAVLRHVLAVVPRPAQAFVCGPPAMVDAAATALEEVGFPRESVHAERF
jgi:predicted ferric reductase